MSTQVDYAEIEALFLKYVSENNKVPITNVYEVQDGIDLEFEDSFYDDVVKFENYEEKLSGFIINLIQEQIDRLDDTEDAETTEDTKKA